MIRVSIHYPSKPGAKFDVDYYAGKHMDLVTELLKPAGLVRWEVDKGLSGPAPDSPAPFVAVGHLYFNTVDDFQKAFAAHGAAVMGDLPNFTDIEGQIQINEIIG